MENVSLKLEGTIARQVEKAMHAHHYSTKTEFIRDAIRCRLQSLSADEKSERAWDALMAARGILKGKGKSMTDAEWRANKLKAGEEFIRTFDQQLNQK